MDENLNKLINNICWWIPFKNKRNNLRHQLISIIEDKFSSLNGLNYELKNKLEKISNNDCYNLDTILNAINNTVELTTFYNDDQIKKNIFLKNVKFIEIGIFSFCNRKCWFCPNSIVDRFSSNIELDENLFIKILKELQEIDYFETISLYRYNEPLYDKKLLLKRIKQTREYLPKANIKLNTNGDYLTLEYLKELEAYGVNKLYITYYYNGNDKNIKFDLENTIKPGMFKLINKLGLNYHENLKSNYEYYIYIEYKSMYIEYRAIDMHNLGLDRGGIIDNVVLRERKSQCFLPNIQVPIDYDGSYTLCCNTRSDVIEHKDYIIGNVKNNTIFELFTNKKIIDFRKKLLVFGEKDGACHNCLDLRSWIGYF